MSGPPNDVPASELVRVLSQPRPSEVVSFPRKGVETKIRIQVLRLTDHDEARIMAWEDVKKLRVRKEDYESVASQAVYHDACARHVLFRSVVSVEPISEDDPIPKYARLFASADELRDSLTADELVSLYNRYLITQHKFGPYERTIESDEDLDAWVQRLVEGLSDDPLDRLTLPQLVELIMSMAARVYTLCESQDTQYWSSRGISTSDPESSSSDIDSSGGLLEKSTTEPGPGGVRQLTPEEARKAAKDTPDGG